MNVLDYSIRDIYEADIQIRHQRVFRILAPTGSSNASKVT
ncbi:hypothetical protein HMPREF0733_10395 [Rothia dentocariosa ATCC 17931]|uniref:Uncharacterized protein n=1 Tax=Rothia dentocariosa (strain ATCC 17931 / CDC X599 / XDIA) TaxID=762948 RepID=E3H046_ROTDC|nr:hypothetical protein HMPREF0733_10395 [Rothia dentocariosa ATCC 17931]